MKDITVFHEHTVKCVEIKHILSYYREGLELRRTEQYGKIAPRNIALTENTDFLLIFHPHSQIKIAISPSLIEAMLKHSSAYESYQWMNPNRGGDIDKCIYFSDTN